MTQLPQVLVNVRVSHQLPDIAELLATEIDEAGRAFGGTGRILVRPSGTEPLVRVMVEAPTEELARCDRGQPRRPRRISLRVGSAGYPSAVSRRSRRPPSPSAQR